MMSLEYIKNIGSKKAMERVLEKRFKGKIQLFLAELNESFNDLLRTDIKRAGKFLKLIKPLFRFLAPEFQSRLMVMEARYARFSGDNKIATAKYEKALIQNNKYRNYEANARLRKGLMSVYMYLGKYPEAIKTGRLALTYFRKNNLISDCGQILNNIGNIYHRMDKVDKALEYYEQAREIYKKKGGVPLAIIDFNRANIYSVKNELTTAAGLYHKAGKIYRDTGNYIAACQVDYSLAIIDYWQNRYPEALSGLENAVDRLQKLGDPRTAIIAMLDLAELYVELNMYSSAVYYAEEIIKFAGEMKMNYERAKAHYIIARASNHFKDFEKATASLKLAEKYFKSESNVLWLGLVNLEKSFVLLGRGRYNRARESALRAVRQFGRSGDRYRLLSAKIQLIEIKLKSTGPGTALQSAKNLIRINLPNSLKQRLYFLMGFSYFERKNHSEALKWFKKTIRIIEQTLEIMSSDETRYFYAADKYDIYKKMIFCLLKLGKTKASYLNSLRALKMINKRSAGEDRRQKKVPKELLEQRNGLRAALKKIHRTPQAGQRVVLAEAEVFNIEQKLWSVERKIRKAQSSSMINAPDKSRLSLPAENQIGENERLLNYVTLGNEIGVYIASARKQKYRPLPVTSESFRSDLHKLSFVCEKAVFGFNGDGRTSSDINHILNRIYDYLIKPIADEISDKDLILLANGDFFQVPFTALRDDSGNYLMDSHCLYLICDPSVLADRRKNELKYSKRNHAVFASGIDNLPAAGIEAKKIARMFKKSTSYMNNKASRENFLGALKKSDGFLHIAAHASHSTENPLFSKIILDDGPLYPFDIYGMNLRPTLITLSGCHTAAPGLYYGNSFSMAKAYYQAGSRFVLGSLWPISDKIATYFMINFYKQLSKTNNIPLAYKITVDIISSTIANPALWGSFILLGI